MLLSRRRGGRRSRTVRRLVAVALLLAAGALALAPGRGTEGRAVLVAAHDLPVGTVLTASDLRTAAVPAPPDGALPAADPGVATGRAVASPVRRGEVLTDVRLLGDGGPDPGPGRVALPIPVGDRTVAGLLRPGMRVTLVGVSGGSSGGAPGTVRASPLTGAAIVLATASDPDQASARGGAVTVLVSVPAEVAPTVTAAAVADSLLVQFGS